MSFHLHPNYRALSARRIMKAALAASLVLFASAAFGAKARAADAAAPPSALTPPPEVRRVIDRRCAVCHGCYDSPCQLNMTSAAGLLRGASKSVVYDAQRLDAARPTRLGVDGKTTEDWRRMGFFSVGPDEGADKIETSQIWNMLKLKREHPLKAGAPLPASLPLELDRPLSCPKPGEFADYGRDRPQGGMPYGLAPLTDAENKTLTEWLKAGSPMSAAPPGVPEGLGRQIAEWETFFNQDDPKHRLVARYLYEHLYLGHLSFDGDETRFFRLVRSTTAPGTPAEPIATRRPYDDPGVKPFYYRLTPIEETLLHKTHIVYRLGAERLERFRELFIHPEWTVGEPPSHEPSVASNPFKAFAAIPAAARSRFLLDDAMFFVQTFVAGPSCRGQVAVDVIDDRFWVMFLSPDADLSVTDPSYLKGAAELLGLPAERANAGLGRGMNPAHLAYHRRYLDYRRKRYNNSDPERLGFAMKDIWDGGEANPNALLTVFRHFDSASVVKGFAGATPKTAWVIDYPIFERIYYNLVAGFDVYGNVEHQLGSRIYMDLLRMESEELFLQFLPKQERRRLQRHWYGGALAKIVAYLENGLVAVGRDTRIAYKSRDAKEELLAMALARGQGRWPVADPINRCAAAPCAGGAADPAGQAVENALRDIATSRGPWVRRLPEAAVLRVRGEGGADGVYTLIHDRAHSNVALMFFEEQRLLPALDEMTVYPGLASAYPNFYFDITGEQLAAFVKEMKEIESDGEFAEFADKYGVRRSSPRFWEVTDALLDGLQRQNPVEAGLFDVNRYVDPKAAASRTADAASAALVRSALKRVMRQTKEKSGQMTFWRR